MSLDNFPRKTIATKVITVFLLLILTLNNFILNCENFIQIKGCAMGTICAPSYGNIFMDHFERKYISPFLQGLSLIYLRFIDDLFFIWTGSKEQFFRTLDELNTKHDPIKFEYKISKTSISFLDTEVYIKNNKIYTKIYRKQTDRQSFLYIDSEHPKSLKNSIPYNQALRIERICTPLKDFEYLCKELKQRFLEQRCNSELLGKQIKTVEKLDRNELGKGNKKDMSISTRIPLGITYNRFIPNISKIIQKNWNILSVNESLKKEFQNEQFISFKGIKNLKELIGSNKIENNIVKKINKSTLKPGKYSPGFRNSRTLCCNQVITTSTFKSQQTQKTCKIFHEVNFSSAYVIY